MLGIIFSLLFYILGMIYLFRGPEKEMIGLYFLFISSMWYIGSALWVKPYKKEDKKNESHDL